MLGDTFGTIYIFARLYAKNVKKRVFSALTQKIRGQYWFVSCMLSLGKMPSLQFIAGIVVADIVCTWHTQICRLISANTC